MRSGRLPRSRANAPSATAPAAITSATAQVGGDSPERLVVRVASNEPPVVPEDPAGCVAVVPLACAPAAAAAPDDGTVDAEPDTAEEGRAVEEPRPVGAAAAPPEPPAPEAATKRPVRCHRPEKPLNGPPTTWLVHWSV